MRRTTRFCWASCTNMAWRSEQWPAGRRRLLAVGIVAGTLLAGCATPGLLPGGSQGAVAQREEIAGRLSLVSGPADAQHALYGGFRLVLQGESGAFDVFSPLGQMLAQAKWNVDAASLDDGRTVRNFSSFSAMTESAIGVALPRAALQDWVRGRPAASLAFKALPEGAFEQLGWTVQPTWRDGRLTLVTAERGGETPAQLRLAITAEQRAATSAASAPVGR